MRITNQMLLQNLLVGLRSNLAAIDSAQRESATGRRVNTVSDDPVDASQIMRMDQRLRDIDQYKRNGIAATTRLSTEDAVLTSVRSLLDNAKSAAMSGATQDPNDPLRQAAIQQVDQIRAQLVSLGNTKVGNEYIFGGGQTTTPPFQADGTYTGDNIVRQAEVDAGVMVDANHTGDQLFSSAFQALNNLSNELVNGTPDTIQGTVGSIDAASQQALGAQTEDGATLQQIQDATSRLATQSTNVADQRDSLQNVDPSEAVVNVMAAQTALERAYSVIGRVLSVDLTQYLR